MLKPLLFLALLPTLAHARIGETPEQCAKRYGDLAESRGTAARAIRIFIMGGVTTTCYLADDKCVSITFDVLVPSRTEYEVPTDPEPVFSRLQVVKLIEANKGESEWVLDPQGGGTILYTSKDGSRRAISKPEQVTIQTTADFEARKKLILPEAIDKDIEGF